MVPHQQLKDMLLTSDIFALPSAGVHIFSLLEGMSAGTAVVTSDGWGIQDYAKHDWNSLVIQGIRERITQVDAHGIKTWEDFRPMLQVKQFCVDQLVDYLSELIENKPLRKRLSRNARNDVENKFSVENARTGLKQVFDKVLAIPTGKDMEQEKIWKVPPSPRNVMM